PTALPVKIAEGGTGATTAAAARTALGRGIGVDVQGWNVLLDYYAAFAGAASQIPYFSTASTIGGINSTAFGRSLLAASDAAALRAAVDLEPGVDVQPFDVQLAALAAYAGTASTIPYFSSASTIAGINSAAYGRGLLSASDAA